jgi:site-specific DNA-methyltransferase (adenine-specific)
MSERWAVHHGDCREVMRTLAPESIDSIVTDPPYALGFMGKGWDTYSTGRKQKHNNRFEEFIYDVCEHAFRVAKPGAHLLAFGGTRTYHRLAVAIEDAGWDIRDCVMWVYGSGFPKSHDVSKAIDREAGAEREVVKEWAQTYSGGAGEATGYRPRNYVGKETSKEAATESAKQWSGWGTALKPAYEPIIVARKPLCGTVAENVLTHGTGGINVDGCRVGRDTDDVSGWSQSGSKASENRSMSGGNYARDPNPDAGGRWPANLIHDGSEEVTDLLGDAARFFYCPKASKRDRDEGCEGMEERHNKGSGTHGNGTASTRLGNAAERAAGITHVELQKVRNHHPTVKPTDLMRYLCRLVTPPDGLVLDPFTGSGSTGKAAMLEGFRFVGCELSAEYIEIARARIGHAAGQSRQKELALA